MLPVAECLFDHRFLKEEEVAFNGKDPESAKEKEGPRTPSLSIPKKWKKGLLSSLRRTEKTCECYLLGEEGRERRKEKFYRRKAQPLQEERPTCSTSTAHL